MKKSEHIPWSLIHKALKDSLDDREQKLLDEWLAESESNRKAFKKISLAWNVASSDLSNKFNPDEQAAWDRIVSSTDLKEFQNKEKANANARKTSVLFFIRNAAAILFLPLVITTAVLFVRYGDTMESAIVSVQTEMGQRSQFMLADSTRVWLNSDSRLTHAAGDYKGETRLQLEGEAYFESPESRAGNLVVSTSHMDVQVTGTAFNVRAYPDENSIETVLERGGVKLLNSNLNGSAEKLAALSPGQRAVYDKSNDMLEISDINTMEYTAWRNGVLVFRNATFDELANRLEMWFDVEISYDIDKFNDTEYSGTFRNRENIDQVLEAIKSTTPFEYRTENNKVIIK
ncbi:FecR family protein [Natronogracilivirga saccharolytica]|uniref:DUF4974 domain-containing protein n=1 Tax=Natronogracilivirga saccharolytica TaxID=2812953 RepID=A0A8J7RRX7_9BACT|nr:FecR domain-containing protein [Natronogracilivirga saccharolytica]MBP3192689.1 DUF4974 domain-containing protein [Natronogracilivirga saccharolytica]